VLLSHFTGEPRWDAIGSIAIGILLVVIAILLAVEMKGLLIGESATAADVRQIESRIASAPHVQRLINLRTEHLGPDDLLVAAKVEFAPELSMDQLADAINGVEDGVRAGVPKARLVYIEPDIFRTTTT
jgi:divalent metal cation (Fe/Co/Zn/Cd) transporter